MLSLNALAIKAVLLQLGGKVINPKLAFSPSAVYCYLIQRAALFARDHPTQCPLVLPLLLERSKFRGDDASARGGSRSCHKQSSSAGAYSSTGRASSIPLEFYKRFYSPLGMAALGRVDETYIQSKGVWNICIEPWTPKATRWTSC